MYRFWLGIIAHNMQHYESHEQFCGCWQSSAKTEASKLLKAIVDYGFIVTSIPTYSLLLYMTGIAVKRQKKTKGVYAVLCPVLHFWEGLLGTQSTATKNIGPGSKPTG